MSVHRIRTLDLRGGRQSLDHRSPRIKPQDPLKSDSPAIPTRARYRLFIRYSACSFVIPVIAGGRGVGCRGANLITHARHSAWYSLISTLGTAAADAGKVPGCPGVFAIHIRPIRLYLHYSCSSFPRAWPISRAWIRPTALPLGSLTCLTEETRMPLLKSPGRVLFNQGLPVTHFQFLLAQTNCALTNSRFNFVPKMVTLLFVEQKASFSRVPWRKFGFWTVIFF